jgi:hypothetical protein
VRFTVEHPVGQPGCAPELYQQEGLAAFVQAAEEAGFDAVAFTEHPAPSLKWLQAGGHESLDPLAALAFAAAVTTRIRLMTYLLVLPYRNPLITAKMIATVDLLSKGRLIVGATSTSAARSSTRPSTSSVSCGPATACPSRAGTSPHAARSAPRLRCSGRTRPSGSVATAATPDAGSPVRPTAGCRC